MNKCSATEVVEATKNVAPQTRLDVRPGVELRRTSGGIPVVRLHYTAHPERDPELNPGWKKAERRKYTSQASWDREQEIVDEAGGGELIFTDTLVTYENKIVIKDPRWRPDPDWRVEAGFDHGKTNATAMLRVYHDFEGTIYYAGEYYQPGKEIWQHAPQIKKMVDFERMDPRVADPSIFPMNQQQSQRPGHAAEQAKSFAELYAEEGVEFVPFIGDKSDVSFAGRLLKHWADLENREPTVKIVCPEGIDWDVPQFGLRNWGCPNLLWELTRARRVKLTAQKLLSRNLSEAIVDKDNHARDAMKYHLMSHPEPSTKPLARRVQDRVNAIAKGDEEKGIAADPTMAVIQYQKILREEQEEDEPGYYGAGARRRFAQMAKRRRR